VNSFFLYDTITSKPTPTAAPTVIVYAKSMKLKYDHDTSVRVLLLPFLISWVGANPFSFLIAQDSLEGR